MPFQPVINEPEYGFNKVDPEVFKTPDVPLRLTGYQVADKLHVVHGLFYIVIEAEGLGGEGLIAAGAAEPGDDSECFSGIVTVGFVPTNIIRWLSGWKVYCCIP